MRPHAPAADRKRALSPRSKGLLLVAILVVAAFLRFYRIGSLPPGDGYDPAYYGVDALRILDGARPIFLESNFGREVLFSYLVTLSVALFGVGPPAIHIAAAFVGLLTVVALFLLGEELFAEESGALGEYGGLGAALVVAVSYWHLNWSRFGVRAILVPLFSALVFYFLWRGLRTERRWTFVAAGIALGLSVYTYQAARILPVLVVLAFVFVALRRGRVLRRDVVNLLIVALVSILVFAPLGLYFLEHPAAFTQRVEQTVVFDPAQGWGANLRALGREFWETVLVFSFRGDDEPIHNLPGRPALNPFLSVLFFLGLVFAVVRARRPRYAFLLAWLMVMASPAILSTHGPATKRAIGTFPAVMLLLAVGGLATWDALKRWLARYATGRAALARGVLFVALATGLLYSGARTYYDYFVLWGSDPDLFSHYEAGTAAIGHYAGSLPAGEPIYVSPVLPAHPSLRYNSGLRPDVRGYNGRVCFVLPEETGAPVHYVVVPGDDAQSLDLLEHYYPQGAVVAAGPLHYNHPYFLAYRVPGDQRAAVEPEQELHARWGEAVELVGYDLAGDGSASEPFAPGETLEVTLYWRVLAPLTEDYTAYVHLRGGPENPAVGANLWGQDDSEPCRRFYPTSEWEPGEVVLDRYAVTLAPETPAGTYALTTGFYLWPSLEPLPLSAGQGEGGAALLQEIEVAP